MSWYNHCFRLSFSLPPSQWNKHHRARFIRVGEMTGLAGLLKMTVVPQPLGWTAIGGFGIHSGDVSIAISNLDYPRFYRVLEMNIYLPHYYLMFTKGTGFWLVWLGFNIFNILGRWGATIPMKLPKVKTSSTAATLLPCFEGVEQRDWGSIFTGSNKKDGWYGLINLRESAVLKCQQCQLNLTFQTQEAGSHSWFTLSFMRVTKYTAWLSTVRLMHSSELPKALWFSMCIPASQ